MKFSFNLLCALFAVALSLSSCRTSDDAIDSVIPTSEMEGLLKIKEIDNDTHTIELYSRTGSTNIGYNEISLRIKNKATNAYENNAEITWTPLMHMTSMVHSCPNSAVLKASAQGSLYSGYIVFQMADNATEYWDLKIEYTMGEKSFSATTRLSVSNATRRNVSVFTGSDQVKYIVAYISPTTPKVATNEFTVGVWKMQNMTSFPLVDGYTVKIDPRMPSMDNHTSPSNVPATQLSAGQMYQGKLALTMTGYWKINLQLMAPDGGILKGEEVTKDNPASSIFFEIEF